MSNPTPEQIADAIEILDMCKPIRDQQGGMWFSRNQNLADATFVDYGACRAFAVAARALPSLVEQNAALVKALADIIEANKDFRDGMPQSWDGDPLQDACDAAKTLLEAIKVPA